MQGGRGSIGQRALGLHLQDAVTGAPIGFGRAVWRNVVFALAADIVVGYFTPLFDGSGRHQGWHDKAARAVVVDTRRSDASSLPAAAPVTYTGAMVPVVAPAVPAPAPGPAYRTPVPVAYAAAPTYAPPVGYAAPSFSAAPASAPAPVAQPAASAPAPAPVTPVPAPVAPPAGPAFAPAPVAPPAAPAPAPATVAIPTMAAPTVPVVQPAMALAMAGAPAADGAYAVHPAAPSPAPTHGDDLAATRAAAPAPAERAALDDAATVIAVLTWDDGARMAVYGPTVYGRNPVSEPGLVRIAVRDETLSMSKTHFEIGGDATGAWIVDRHSTNGTTLVRDGGRIPLFAGVRTSLRSGDVLELGDRRATVGLAR
jgi:hypothetical protein